MPRIRSIRVEFFNDETTGSLHPDAQLLLIGLATLADKHGLLEDRPRRIKAILFPYRDVDVDHHLDVLHHVGEVHRYTANGQACVHLTHFARDQKPHPKETSFGLPAPSRETSRQDSDASRRVPMVVGCGSGGGSGSGCGSSASQASPSASPANADDVRQAPTCCGNPEACGGCDLPPPASQRDVRQPTEAAEKGPSGPQEPPRPAAPPVDRGELVLTPSEAPRAVRKPEKAQRRMSAAEELYRQVQDGRRAAVERWNDEVRRTAQEGLAGNELLPFVEDGWHAARQNKELGPAAKDEAALARFGAAFNEYLNDPDGARREPPWSLSFFVKGEIRARYETRAAKAAGGGT